MRTGLDDQWLPAEPPAEEPRSEETPPGEALPPVGPPEPVRETAEAGSGAEAGDFRDRWLRAEAELQNFRKRARRDLEEARRSAEESVMLGMIDALDDLDRALEAAREAQAAEPLIQGVELVASRLRDYLLRQGVVVLDPLGERFDPDFHEALLEVDAPPGVEGGRVVQVALKGYRRGARALRAARVVVSRTSGEGGA